MTTKKARTVFLALGLSWIQFNSTSAQELPQLEAKTDPAPYAKLREAAQVSAARVVVGLVLGSQPVGLNPKMIAQLPDDWSGESACARLLSPDALFEAVAEYEVNDIVAGKTAALALTFNDDDLETVQARKMDQLAMTVSRGNCDSSPEEFAISMINEPLGEAFDTLTVFVNSQNAARVTAEIKQPGGNYSTFRCHRSDAPSSVGFDHLCNLPLEAFPPDDRVELRINRRDRFGGIEQPATLVVSTIGSND